MYIVLPFQKGKKKRKRGAIMQYTNKNKIKRSKRNHQYQTYII